MKRRHRKYRARSGGLKRVIQCWHLSIPSVPVNLHNGSMVLIGLGSSLDDRVLNLQKGLLWMAYDPYIDLVSTSSVWQTMPIGAAKNVFYNMCAIVHTTYSPQELMDRLLSLEKRCNRLRGIHWMDRTLDLDVLLYEHSVLETPKIIIPHPRMLERSFVMQPALEIAADWIHPNIKTELRDCSTEVDSGMWKVGVFSIAHKN